MTIKRSLEKKVLIKISHQLVKILAERKIDPFLLTYSAFGLTLFAALLYSLSKGSGLFIAIAGFILLLSGFLDALDGELARTLKKVSRKGSFLDSVLDKLGEVFIALGIFISKTTSALLVILFITCSLLVSYVRAKSEQLGVEVMGVGIAERAERIIILAVTSFFYPIWNFSLEYGLLLITLLSVITIIQRILYVYKQLL